ncbi:MAG TPA: efflux RND transporter periplasmic adaptor subunit [Gemmatimonadaceae bacterium]
MTRKQLAAGGGAALLVAAVIVYLVTRPPASLVLTGVVTTNDVIVSPQVGGQINRLLVAEGDSVTQHQLLAVLAPGELAADQSYYAQNAQALASQVNQSAADLHYQETQADEQVRQTEATLAAAIAQAAMDSATMVNSKQVYDRYGPLLSAGAVSSQQVDSARTQYTVALARFEASSRQVEAQRAAVAMARAAEDQVQAKRSALAGARQAQAAAQAQTRKADVRLGYAELRAPMGGVVDVRAARAGEYVAAGQPVVTLVNPDSLWVRADVEETYIDRVRLGDHLTVRLPSGVERQGTVFFRGVDADFATQRDVSRTKRDIKTFEIRIRVDNHDRRLADGMTAYVVLPLDHTRSS